MEPVVAAFDVDGTLTVRDCVVPFMRSTVGTVRFASICLRSAPRIARLVLARDRDAIKALFVRAVFAGRDVDAVESAGVVFAARVAEGWLRHDVAARMRWHQSEGHVVVFVSASLEPYLVPLGDLCEVDAVLCTALEEEGGVYTGALHGANCRGDEKVSRLYAWMDSAGIPRTSLGFAYGDSAGDTALLAAADAAFNVRSVDLTAVPA